MKNETTEQTVTRWLADGETFVGVYENADLGSNNVGHRIAMPFELSDFDRLAIGSRSPDTDQIIGWRYLLVDKCKTVERGLAQSCAVTPIGVRKIKTSPGTNGTGVFFIFRINTDGQLAQTLALLAHERI